MSQDLVAGVGLIIGRELEKKHCTQRDSEKLQTLVSRLVAESKIPAQSRCEVRDYADSSISVKTTRVIAEKYDAACSRMPVRIQLVGCTEKWIVDIYPTKDEQKNLKGFAAAIKHSALVMHEQFKKQTPAAADPPIDNNDDLNPVNEMHERKTKSQQRKTSDILNQEIICALLEKGLERGGVMRTLEQSDFNTFLKKIGVNCSVQAAVAYLKKKGFIEVKPIHRKPQLVITISGCSLVATHRQFELKEKEAAAKVALREEALRFPVKAHSLLKKMRSVVILQKNAQEYLEKERAQVRLNDKLRAELAAGETELEKLKTEKQKFLNRLEECIAGLSLNSLDHMVELAEKASAEIG